ncbi:MAG: single-stranded-DNA-specific exonuclease RecJ [Clostridiales bacterium]|nr:single-stranded-DNA-specific exonuclease RecJ [Clostridiales bacterium]
MVIKKKEIAGLEHSNIIKLSNAFKLDQNIIKLLYLRGYKTKEQISDFLSPKVTKFYDPYLLKDMDKVVSRIRRAIRTRESVVILGDYDTDGISATAIMYKYFESVGLKVNVFLPNRIADGYGLSKDSIDKLNNNFHPSLIITVDCGISAYQEIEYAKSLGIEVVVTDHHDIPDIIPKALIINPKLPNQKYPFQDLCGAGVALKVIQALVGVEASIKYLTIASLATVADIVPLVDENRIITYFGIKNQKEDMPIGLQKLIRKLRLETPLSSTDISFKLAPKINATGRMGDPNIAFKLYISDNVKEITENIDLLLELNDRRVAETNSIVDQAVAMLNNVNTSKLGIIVVKNDNWESGVLGIICSKLVDIYNKPACVLTMIDGELKGSLRSIPSINIYNVLNNVKDTLVQFGGHNQAAGVTLDPSKFYEFRERINKYILNNHTQDDFLVEKKYDLDLSKITLNDKFIRDLSVLEPFGLCNEKPLFKLTFNNVAVSTLPKFPNHIRAKINNIDLVGFNFGGHMHNLNANSNKTMILELNIDKKTQASKLKGVIKYIAFSKLNTTVKTELVTGMYLNQLKYIGYEKGNGSKTTILNEKELYTEIKKLNTSNKFGTLVISNSIDTYNKFNENILDFPNYELYTINNKTGLNTLIFAPSNYENIVNYDNVILLDAPMHMGLVNYLAELGKNVIICNNQFDKKVLKNLDYNRSVFGKYHNAIKQCAKRPGNNTDLLMFYSKLKKANPQFSNIKFNQFVFVVLVLEQLGICVVDGGNITFTDVKSNLKESGIYNFVSLLLNSIRGE